MSRARWCGVADGGLPLQELQEQLEQGQSPDVVNGNVVSPLTAEVEELRQENSLYRHQVEVSFGVDTQLHI